MLHLDNTAILHGGPVLNNCCAGGLQAVETPPLSPWKEWNNFKILIVFLIKNCWIFNFPLEFSEEKYSVAAASWAPPWTGSWTPSGLWIDLGCDRLFVSLCFPFDCCLSGVYLPVAWWQLGKVPFRDKAARGTMNEWILSRRLQGCNNHLLTFLIP